MASYRGHLATSSVLGAAYGGAAVWYAHMDWAPACLAGGVMLGFLSHLVLDELCAVDFSGARLRLNRFAGSALKLASPSWTATILTYLLLFGLSFLAFRALTPP